MEKLSRTLDPQGGKYLSAEARTGGQPSALNRPAAILLSACHLMMAARNSVHWLPGYPKSLRLQGSSIHTLEENSGLSKPQAWGPGK